MLQLEASAGIYTHIDGAHARVPVGRFKIGRIAQEGKPHLSNHVSTDDWLSDPEWAKQQGMAAFAGYPLALEGRCKPPSGSTVLATPLSAASNLSAVWLKLPEASPKRTRRPLGGKEGEACDGLCLDRAGCNPSKLRSPLLHFF